MPHITCDLSQFFNIFFFFDRSTMGNFGLGKVTSEVSNEVVTIPTECSDDIEDSDGDSIPLSTLCFDKKKKT